LDKNPSRVPDTWNYFRLTPQEQGEGIASSLPTNPDPPRLIQTRRLTKEKDRQGGAHRGYGT
jgi:hypothetical protein